MNKVLASLAPLRQRLPLFGLGAAAALLQLTALALWQQGLLVDATATAATTTGSAPPIPAPLVIPTGDRKTGDKKQVPLPLPPPTTPSAALSEGSSAPSLESASSSPAPAGTEQPPSAPLLIASLPRLTTAPKVVPAPAPAPLDALATRLLTNADEALLRYRLLPDKPLGTPLKSAANEPAPLPWPQGADPERFTIQVLAGSEERIASSSRDLELPAPVARYRFINRGVENVALISGEYQSFAAALAVAQRLSRRYRVVDPWIRPLGDIQALMADYANQPQEG